MKKIISCALILSAILVFSSFISNHCNYIINTDNYTDSFKTISEIDNYYNGIKASNHYQYVVAKQNLVILKYVNTLQVTENIKVQLFKLVTYQEPKPDVSKMSDQEFQEYLKKERSKAHIMQAKYLKRKERVLEILGDEAGRKFWLECINILASFNEEAFKETGGVPKINVPENK